MGYDRQITPLSRLISVMPIKETRCANQRRLYGGSGAQTANVALLVNYLASTFTLGKGGHGPPKVAATPLVAIPSHARRRAAFCPSVKARP